MWFQNISIGRRAIIDYGLGLGLGLRFIHCDANGVHCLVNQKEWALCLQTIDIGTTLLNKYGGKTG